MRPFKFTVYELFEKDRRHVVPLFQRPYVWRRVDQWEPLWNDLLSKAEELLQDNENQLYNQSHFMGAIVLNDVQTFGKQVKKMDIIDGQQRLTTLQILLVALRDFVKDINYDTKLFTKLEKLTKNDFRESEIEQYKVWPTNSDQDCFAYIVSAGSKTAVERLYPRAPRSRRETLGRPVLAEAYSYFYDEIEDFVLRDDTSNNDQTNLNDASRSAEKLEALYKTLTDHFELVLIELEKGDNPQIIFETLNARGVPLLPSDLIRNFVFLEASNRGEEIEKIYERYWREFDEPFDKPNFWKTEERQGRLTRPRIDLLIFYYLTYQTQKELSITSLFQEFSNWWRVQNVTNVEEQLQTLQYFASVFKQFFETREPSRINIFARRLRELDTSTVYPLLLFIFGEAKDVLSLAERDGIVIDLESYLIRRMICGLSGKSYNRFFLGILQSLKKENHLSRAAVQRLLLGSNAPTFRWPNDEEFMQAWLYRAVYETSPRRTLMILDALNLQLHTTRQEKIIVDDKLSVEHIWPQNPEQGSWPSLPDEYIDIIHTFGNLTLVTPSFNSELSNKSFAQKRGPIAQESNLRLNSYFQRLSDDDPWSENSIQERGMNLFETACKIWPYPTIETAK